MLPSDAHVNAKPHRLRKLVLTLFALAALLLAYSGVVDQAGRDYTDAGFKRALVTFGIARGLNGVISVAQGTEVAFEPAGVGLVFTPGEILDPVNDLIERFSWVMLVSATSLGIQRVLLDMTAWPGYTLIVSGVVLGALAWLWLRPADPGGWRRRALQLAMLLLVVRFAIPLIALAGEGIYGLFLEPRYASSTEQLEQTTERIGRINRDTQEQISQDEKPGLLERARRAYDSAAASLDVDSRVQALSEAAARVSEHTVDLIVVFVIQTVLLPLLFLWLLVRLVKGLGGWLRRGFGSEPS